MEEGLKFYYLDYFLKLQFWIAQIVFSYPIMEVLIRRRYPFDGCKDMCGKGFNRKHSYNAHQ